jgi:glycosyltransferase involved in cell wall biosynthesis
VTLEGRYGHLSEIPLAEADAWLYTSGWDGVPSQLLEVAVTGVPIVGTLVGGTGEVLHEGESWPVPQDAGAAAYDEALRGVLADPVDARRRALALRDRMLRERTADGFAERVSALLLTDEGERA